MFKNSCIFSLGELKCLLEDGELSIKDSGKNLIESLPYNFPPINIIVTNDKDSVWTVESDINFKALIDYIDNIKDLCKKREYRRKKFNLFIIDKDVFDKNRNLIINNFM
jgi:hypothetical protein